MVEELNIAVIKTNITRTRCGARSSLKMIVSDGRLGRRSGAKAIDQVAERKKRKDSENTKIFQLKSTAF